MNQSAILLPSPPKSGSQTLLRLLSLAMPNSFVHIPKLDVGAGHLFCNIVQTSRTRRALNRIINPRDVAIVYGHYAPSSYNLNQIYGRYTPRLTVVPVRPILQTVISLVNHAIAHGFGPLDFRIFGLTEATSGFDKLNAGELIRIVSVKYIPCIINILTGWSKFEANTGIKTIFLPFGDIVLKQAHVIDCIRNEVASLGLDSVDNDSPLLRRIKTNSIYKNITKDHLLNMADIEQKDFDFIESICDACMPNTSLDRREMKLKAYLVGNSQSF